ncbi:hypothetical protein, partial [Nostoc commune]|uniref:hypothetical protein n=1 Tax=Nostoc commune TaxID=1178 RepID=UPI001E460606
EYPLPLRYHRLTFLIELRSISFVSQESQSPPYIPPLILSTEFRWGTYGVIVKISHPVTAS